VALSISIESQDVSGKGSGGHMAFFSIYQTFPHTGTSSYNSIFLSTVKDEVGHRKDFLDRDWRSCKGYGGSKVMTQLLQPHPLHHCFCLSLLLYLVMLWLCCSTGWARIMHLLVALFGNTKLLTASY